MTHDEQHERLHLQDLQLQSLHLQELRVQVLQLQPLHLREALKGPQIMVKIISALVVAAMMLCDWGMTIIAGPADPKTGSWIGEISSSNCGLTHVGGMDPRDCTLECIEGGAAFVLASNGEVYRFANQDDKELRVYAGATVKVTGDLNGRVLKATKIEAVLNGAVASERSGR